MNSIIEKRKQNWLDFYDMNSPVNRLCVMDYFWAAAPRPLLWYEKAAEREEWSYVRYMLQMENLEKVHDNTIPYLSMITGTEIFAEAFGCKVHKPLDNTPFALPMIHDAGDFAKVRMPRLEDTKLPQLFDMADRLKARVGEDALFSLPDIQTPIDVAAIMWDKNDFYAAMFDDEPAIKELCAMIKEFMFTFLDEWFRRYGKACIAHYPDYYMPNGITVSEDEIGVVSSDMYKQYFKDELHDFSDHFGAVGIHCCAICDHQWENFKAVPNLRILNLGRDEENSVKSTQALGGSIPLYYCNNTDISSLPNSRAVHMANYIYTDSLETAIRLSDEYNERHQASWEI